VRSNKAKQHKNREPQDIDSDQIEEAEVVKSNSEQNSYSRH
jgi:hypothetical protein